MDLSLSSTALSTSFAAIVGAVLTRRRRARGINQTVLARVVGLNQAGWSKIERGTISLSLEHLSLVAPELGVSPGVVLDEAERVVRHVEALGVQVVRRRLEAGGVDVAQVQAWVEAVLGA